MNRRLWVAAALAPLTFAAASRADAATTIGSSTSTPVSTSTTGDLKVSGSIGVERTTTSSNGVVSTTNGPADVTVDSANSVTVTGSLSSTEPASYKDSNSDGIVDTDTTAKVSTVGQLAVGSNRYGIDVAGTTQGTFIYIDGGSISVLGENSAGILIGDGGLSGTLTSSGSISATGGNLGTDDVTYGVHAIGRISGLVSFTGAVSVVGKNATAVALDSGAGGVTVSSSLTATGYRSTTAPTYDGYNLILYTPWRDTHFSAADVTKDETLVTPSELMQGGPALSIGGDVTAGVNITAYDSIPSTTIDEGSLVSYGSAPALLIGGSNTITIGAVTGNNDGNYGNVNGYSLQIGGSVAGAGTYYNINGTAIQIGGFNPLAVTSSGTAAGQQFAAVSLPDGIDITGSVAGSALSADIAGQTSATNVQGSASAIGLRIGSGATVSTVRVASVETVRKGKDYYSSGSLTAVVSSNSPTGSPTATALQIDSGANVASLTNTGTISATIQGLTTSKASGATTVTGGTNGTATAISDKSGSLTSVTNSGIIYAAVTPPVGTATTNAKTVAIDLSANTTGATVTQSAGTKVDSSTNEVITPEIIGDITFGTTGAGALDLEAGSVLGAVSYGTSLGNQLTINRGATLTGALTVASGGALNINVANGSLYDQSTSTISSSGLSIGSKGKIVLNVDPRTNSAGQIVLTSGSTATLANGAGIGLNFTSMLAAGSSQNYVVVKTDPGKLTVGTIDTSLDGLIPYIYSATIPQSTWASGELTIAVSTKTASQLGLNAGESKAYDAVYQAVSNTVSTTDTTPTDSRLQTTLLGKTDRASFLKLYDQMLPDYQGGPFESLVSAQRAVARSEAEPPVKLQDGESRGWVEEIGFDSHRDNSAAGGPDGYNAHGFGTIMGVESAMNGQAVGVTAAFLASNVDDNAQTSNGGYLSASVIEGGAYWRGGSGGFSLDASANGGWAFFKSQRLVYDDSASTADSAAVSAAQTSNTTAAVTNATSSTEALYRAADSQWNGGLASAAIQASYQFDLGRFYVRPEAEADYVVLYESGRRETGGGPAVDLAINAQTNTQASARVDAVFGANFGTTIVWRPEVTLGWRQVINGGPANTTAYFIHGGENGGAGTTFTLSPNFHDKTGVLARLGLRAGGVYADFSANAGGEFSNGYQTYDARAVARFLF